MVAPQSSLFSGSLKDTAPPPRVRPPEVAKARRWSRPFSVGSLISESAAVLGHRRGAILGPTFLLMLGALGLLEFSTEGLLSMTLYDLGSSPANLVGLSPLLLLGFTFLVCTIAIVIVVVSSLVMGAITIVAVADHRSKRMSLSTAMGKSWTRLLSLVGDSILTSLCVLAPFALFLVYIAVVLGTQLWFLGEFAVFVLLLSSMFAIAVFGAVSLTIPVTMVDHEHAFQSVTLSWDMTRGRRGTLFGALFVVGVLPLGAITLLLTYVPLSLSVALVLLAPIATVVSSLLTVIPAVAYDLIRWPSGVPYRSPVAAARRAGPRPSSRPETGPRTRS